MTWFDKQVELEVIHHLYLFKMQERIGYKLMISYKHLTEALKIFSYWLYYYIWNTNIGAPISPILLYYIILPILPILLYMVHQYMVHQYFPLPLWNLSTENSIQITKCNEFSQELKYRACYKNCKDENLLNNISRNINPSYVRVI